jgi:predicted nucleic acid-binding protein
MASFPHSRVARRVFVDSSAYLGLLDADDDFHDQAVAIVSELVHGGWRQLTTNVLVIECHALLLSSLGMAPAAQFLRDIDASRTTIVRVRASDEARAKQIIFQYTDKDFSFTDAISFAVMERLGITRAFTFDRHFAQYGFTQLTPGQV